MTELLTREEGRIALGLARKAIEEYLSTGTIIKAIDVPAAFQQKRGVFVTLNNRSGQRKELRGCIGRPYPIMPLGDAIVISAINAATDDPRFTSVTKKEMESIHIEVTVLTMPQPLQGAPEARPGKIEVGRHGLIVQMGPYSGLLLPQVAVEHGFDAQLFLDQTCMKAGLFPDAWLEPDTDVYIFEGQIFQE